MTHHQSRDPLARALSGRMSRRTALRGLAGAAGVTSGSPTRLPQRPFAAAPVTGHPRLWLTAAALPRQRGWATNTNPLWKDGLLVLAEKLSADMDAGHVPGKDGGSTAWEEYPTENYAEFFAFLALVHPDGATRDDFARRARTLLR